MKKLPEHILAQSYSGLPFYRHDGREYCTISINRISHFKFIVTNKVMDGCTLTLHSNLLQQIWELKYEKRTT